MSSNPSSRLRRERARGTAAASAAEAEARAAAASAESLHRARLQDPGNRLLRRPARDEVVLPFPTGRTNEESRPVVQGAIPTLLRAALVRRAPRRRACERCVRRRSAGRSPGSSTGARRRPPRDGSPERVPSASCGPPGPTTEGGLPEAGQDCRRFWYRRPLRATRAICAAGDSPASRPTKSARSPPRPPGSWTRSARAARAGSVRRPVEGSG